MDKSGDTRRYESVLVRRSYREGGKVMHQTLANLSKLPERVVSVVEAALKGVELVAAQDALAITRSLPPRPHPIVECGHRGSSRAVWEVITAE